MQNMNKFDQIFLSVEHIEVLRILILRHLYGLILQAKVDDEIEI